MPKADLEKLRPVKITIDKNMPDYSQDPAFKKQLERAKAFLKKYGMPKGFKGKLED